MRIRRRITYFLSRSVVPAIAIAITTYFSYYAFAGPRGVFQLRATEAELAVKDQQLAELHHAHALERAVGERRQCRSPAWRSSGITAESKYFSSSL